MFPKAFFMQVNIGSGIHATYFDNSKTSLWEQPLYSFLAHEVKEWLSLRI